MKILSICNSPIKNNTIYSQKNANNKLYSSDCVSFRGNISLIGQHFDNIGTIVAQQKLLNIKTQEMVPCAVIYSSTPNGGTFHLIRENFSLLTKVQELLKTNPEILDAIKARHGCVLNPNVEKIIKQNKTLAEILKQSIIAEISYMRLHTEDDLMRVARLGYKKIDTDKDIIFIQNLIVNQPEYKNATKTVVKPLLKGLTQKGLNNILIKASAFGKNPKSPIHLYAFFGFKPLNITEEEIEKHTIQTSMGPRLDPNYKIMMYLPKNAILYAILNRIPPLEISQINPNWLQI